MIQPYQQPYRSGNTLRQWAVGLLWVGLVFEGIIVALDWMGMLMFSTWFDETGDISEGELVLGLGLLCSGLLLIIIYITGVVFFLMFIYRCGKNCRSLGASGFEISEGWSVGWFFVPIANLFMPYKAVKEIYQASEPAADLRNWKSVSVPSLLGLWWGFWLASSFLGQIETRLAFQDDVDLVKASIYITAISFPVSALSTYFAVSLLNTLHQRLDQKANYVYAHAANDPSHDAFAHELPCPSCGFDLRGTIAAGGRDCPECGAVMPG